MEVTVDARLERALVAAVEWAEVDVPLVWVMVVAQTVVVLDVPFEEGTLVSAIRLFADMGVAAPYVGTLDPVDREVVADL